MRKANHYILSASFIFISFLSSAQKKASVDPIDGFKSEAIGDLQGKYADYKKIALQIWDYAELGFKEVKSTALLQQTLSSSGFAVQAGVAGMPTAFIATYGSGKPVIGILAEFDALPGLSQEASPEKQSAGKNAGHGCGHHLFGTASVATAIELKKLMDEGKIHGTIKLFGTPAEEGGSGKVYMVRDGFFNNVDVVVHWHPASSNAASYSSSLAVISGKFRFHGISAHAAAAPDKGRSALDAVEGMDFMVNMMREHIPQESRIHYVITNGGKAPNVVPDFAEVFYTVRHPKRDQTQQIFDRVLNAATGATMGTGTSFDYELIAGMYEVLPNRALSEAMQKNIEKVGGVNYTPEETAFAKKIQASFVSKPPSIESVASVEPLAANPDVFYASTDVGDISWVVPTVGMGAATWVAGTPPHSWQAVACGGTEIGTKGMMVAAKSMTLTAIDLFTNKDLIQKATEEFKKLRGEDFTYKCMLGDRKPALDFAQ